METKIFDQYRKTYTADTAVESVEVLPDSRTVPGDAVKQILGMSVTLEHAFVLAMSLP